MALPARWFPLDRHDGQAALFWDAYRFKMCAAGRRSGKTECAKRTGVIQAQAAELRDWWGVFGAPTHAQAKLIYWEDLKQLVPRRWMLRPPRETDLSIQLLNGAELQVVGLDKPERIEGRPLDWICLDEYGNMKPEAWTQHVRPALSTRGREGKAWLIGVPEGRNHYWDLWVQARQDTTGEWGTYHWPSSDILPEAEIQAARATLDERSFQQEYEGSFIDFAGRVYYTFDADLHCRPLRYYPELPLIFCFDFNAAPGVAGIGQEVGAHTHAIGEIWKETDSTTEIICNRLVAQWGHHQGPVHIYGDSSGGAKGAAAVRGSNWAIVEQILPQRFRCEWFVPQANPNIVARINAFNSRLRSTAGTVSMYVDPVACPHLVKDLEGVTEEELRKKDGKLTHISDAWGYYVARRWPIQPWGGGAEPI